MVTAPYGVRLFVEDQGTGRPVVLLPGLGDVPLLCARELAIDPAVNRELARVELLVLERAGSHLVLR